MNTTPVHVPVEIPLSNGGVTIIDAEDAHLAAGHSWFGVQRGRNRYALSFVDGKQVALHRRILGVEGALVVDHIDFDGLNNRRANLRAVTARENGRRKRKPLTSRTSAYKGVTRVAGKRAWSARIRVGDRRFFLGVHPTPTKAAVAYNRVARRVFGPMALLNEIPHART